MPADQNRRRFLQLTGTGLTASTAGCSGAFSIGSDEEGDGYVTAIVQPSQEEFEAAIDEEMSQEELIQQERELFEEAVEGFESRVDDSTITVEESSEDIGLFLIDGAPEAILDGLVNGNVFTLYDGGAYEILLAQNQGGQQEPPTEEDLEGGEDDDGDEDSEDDGDGESDGDDEDSGDDEPEDGDESDE
ncbi:hypothetical protein [Halostagnicola sp. A-GB9-2]|uniref:hypothetical protein n=1 Tax=Halostagnicola sp. A-GB9-2 TaxID=3048066 RepID=UPI0024C08FE2|nr:hypothetical protein [Halostagnicola sp. A-GB9-2]MDJ1431617.1 hypothetical protein [Halostagnicola sp. A-GB9-2]